VDPSAGPAAGGTPVTLSGSGLTDTSAVLVCGEAATDLSVADDSTVSFTTPSGPVGTCDVAVQTSASGSATLADGFRYFATPEVTSVEPGDGPPVGGTQVTVTGSGFTGATSVTFGGTAATDVDVIDDSSVVATSPAHAPGAVDVVVTTPDASGTRSGAFTYYAPPTSLAVSPVAGPTEGGTAITVTGSGLAATSSVTIGGAAVTDLVVVDDSTVTAMTPAGPLGGADVVVTTDGGSTTLADGFTYAEAPEVHVGAGTALWGSTLEVDGEGFAPGSEVSLTLHSTPVHLATVTAGDDGRFTTRVTIPDVEAGLHHLLLDGVDPLGEPVSVQTTITVTAPFETGGSTSTDAAAADPAPTGAPAPVSAAEPAVAADGTLPKTGTDPMGPLATGLGLLVVGSGICVTRRRRLS
jgi:LPXTG-motif cell wall-anchored protein